VRPLLGTEFGEVVRSPAELFPFDSRATKRRTGEELFNRSRTVRRRHVDEFNREFSVMRTVAGGSNRSESVVESAL
jgi:hypothetical protein